MKLEEIANDKRHRMTSKAFAEAMDVATVKGFQMSFADAVKEYHAVQAEFLARINDCDVAALEIRRRIAELILQSAREKKESFETCQHLWKELLLLGFTNIQRKCTMTWFFVDCCRKHRQVDIGLGVLEPLIVEVERLLADPAVKKKEAKYYRYEVDNLDKLRAELKALRT